MVATQASVGMTGAGTNQLSTATYVTNGGHAPHTTPGVPGSPHKPKRSATADRKPAARARRRNHCVSVLAVNARASLHARLQLRRSHATLRERLTEIELAALREREI